MINPFLQHILFHIVAMGNKAADLQVATLEKNVFCYRIMILCKILYFVTVVKFKLKWLSPASHTFPCCDSVASIICTVQCNI